MSIAYSKITAVDFTFPVHSDRTVYGTHVCLCNIYFSPFAGVVEGDLAAVEAYKSSGGDIARQLTSDEVRLLNRPSAFNAGFTLVHLAIRFQRQDMLSVLLTEVSQHICFF